MTCRLTSSSFRRFARTLVVLLASVGTAGACLPAHHFAPPKPLSLPALRELPDPRTLKFDGPKFEPITLDRVLAPRPVEDAKPGVERPLVATLPPDLQAEFVAFVRTFEAAQARKAGVPDRIACAVALIHLGQYAAAIETLLAIEEAHPGVYETAANLGTAYELAGKLEEAFVWIARGIERNGNAQRGTEWLHLAILRAKLRLRDDAGWFREHTVLDGVEDRSAEEILHAIDCQLEARLPLVKPMDAVVCDLFYQAALRVAGANAEMRRAHYLRESLRFGEWRKAEIATRPKT